MAQRTDRFIVEECEKCGITDGQTILELAKIAERTIPPRLADAVHDSDLRNSVNALVQDYIDGGA
jgi:hypothetical protein